MIELTIFLLIFIPVLLVTGYVYVARRQYERASMKKKVKYHLRRK
ncbi:MAG: hypothetical protein K0Q49_830 [Haloplasmataceae bacterium]|jgi:hypothetical protein|nr:hypothetical protein [Haloplasmataceae bacterium]